MFSLSKESFRQQFLSVWEKHQSKQVLSALETQILDVILSHPEYQAAIENQENTSEEDKSRAFMHMSLHIALIEQLSTNRPEGIQALFLKAVEKWQVHLAEHHFMEVLGNFMWEMARDNKAPDDSVYLEKLKERLSQHGIKIHS